MSIEQELSLALGRTRRSGSPVGMLFLDLDRFKEVNDRFGHAGGDEALRAVAERLRRAVRETDLVTRHGGDEFLVLTPDLDPAGSGDPASAQRILRSVAERIHAALADPLPILGEAIHLSVSIGMSLFPSPASDGPSLIRQADAAMYQAKRQGRGATRFYVPPD